MIELDLARAHMAMRLEEANSYRIARDVQRQARATRGTRPVGGRRLRYFARMPVPNRAAG
jgi:hypothetical protein